MPKKKSSPPARGRLRSMRVTDSFRDFVLDQLSGVRHVRARAMFGGIGLYMDDIFFGILAADVLYFKVGETNRPDYDAAGSRRPVDDDAVLQRAHRRPGGRGHAGVVGAAIG